MRELSGPVSPYWGVQASLGSFGTLSSPKPLKRTSFKMGFRAHSGLFCLHERMKYKGNRVTMTVTLLIRVMMPILIIK